MSCLWVDEGCCGGVMTECNGVYVWGCICGGWVYVACVIVCMRVMMVVWMGMCGWVECGGNSYTICACESWCGAAVCMIGTVCVHVCNVCERVGLGCV